MRRIPLAALAIAVVVAAPSAAAAQRSFASAARPSVRAATPDTASAAKAQALVQRADQRWHAYDLAGARRDYTLAVDLLRAKGLYAGPALVALAHVTYTIESRERTAKVLVDAASEAARFGDLPLQVSSLFEASVLYHQSGDDAQARELLSRVERLLSSPYVPQDVKDDIRRRIEA